MNPYEANISIIGIGGVGGYLAALLCEQFPNITLVARGQRKEALLQNGLILHSEYMGDYHIKSPNVVSSVSELTAPDLIFLCVKSYSLEEICEQLRPVIKKGTIIVPVMNGVDPGQRVRALLPEAIVVDSLIYIVAFSNPDYSYTQQGSFANLKIGMYENSDPETIHLISSIFSDAKVDHEVSDDILSAIWRKYILNCAYNVTTAAYDRTIGELRNDPDTRQLYEDLVNEAYEVCKALKINLPRTEADAIINSYYHELKENATSSLQRDVNAKRPTELELFSGYLIRQAHALQIPVPVSERMYELIKNRIS